jgi:hypothetical protein
MAVKCVKNARSPNANCASVLWISVSLKREQDVLMREMFDRFTTGCARFTGRPACWQSASGHLHLPLAK